MSLTSNLEITDYLILNLGLFPSNDKLNMTLKNNKKNQTIELKPSQMNSTDWDEVLGLIIKTKKTITL